MDSNRETLSPANFSLDVATEKDLPDVWQIIDANSDWLVSQGHTHWKEWYTKDLVAEKIAHGHQFIAKKDGVAVGTVNLDTKHVGYYLPEEIAQFEEPDAPALYIGALGVTPEYHNQGIGSEIMNLAEEYARKLGLQLIRFDCKAALDDLVRFYTTKGYAHVGDIIDHSQNDALYYLMEKKL